MARSDLTAERLRSLLHYCHETGAFTRAVNRRRWKAGEPAGHVCSTSGYVIIGLDYYAHFAHRLAWLYAYGGWPAGMIDHINGDRSDNRLSNLRQASPVENSQNQRRARSDNLSSGVLGVSWCKHVAKWRAKIQHEGKTLHVGLFDSIDAAHAAYVAKKRELHPACTL